MRLSSMFGGPPFLGPDSRVRRIPVSPLPGFSGRLGRISPPLPQWGTL
jgi:hypothetical protein